MDSVTCNILTFYHDHDDEKVAIKFEHNGDSVTVTVPGRGNSVILDRTDAEDVAGFLKANLSAEELGFAQ